MTAQQPSSSRRTRGALLRHNKLATLGAGIAVIVFLLGLLAPWVTPYDPIEQDTPNRLQPPSAAHLLGTEQFGRDIVARLVFGSRTTLLVALTAVAVALLAGGGLGLFGGFIGGDVERLIGMLMDVLLSFPLLLLAILVAFILGPGIFNLAVAVGVSQIPIPNPTSQCGKCRVGAANRQRTRKWEAGRYAEHLGSVRGRGSW
jgi:peptide/nickel transport system permease protein